MALVNFSEYARQRGVTLKAVQRAIESGRITTVNHGIRKLIDTDIADKQWDENTDSSYIRNGAQETGTHRSGSAPPLQESRAIREAYNARITKLEYEEKIGKLIDLEQSKAAGFELCRRVRNALLNIPGKISPELAAETDPYKIEIILQKEIDEALRDLATE